jgi:putative mycofactocin binding protein MftB
LAYHYDNRRLNFIRSQDLLTVVRCLGDHPSAEAAFSACNIDEQRWPSFRRALESLVASDFLEPVGDPPGTGAPTPQPVTP